LLIADNCLRDIRAGIGGADGWLYVSTGRLHARADLGRPVADDRAGNDARTDHVRALVCRS
jgi:hypothetical protein